jgi:hypothetical protein
MSKSLQVSTIRIVSSVERIQREFVTFRIGSKKVTAAERKQRTPVKRKLSVSISNKKTFYYIPLKKIK